MSWRKFKSRIVCIFRYIFIFFHSRPFFLKIKVMKVKKIHYLLFNSNIYLFICLYRGFVFYNTERIHKKNNLNHRLKSMSKEDIFFQLKLENMKWSEWWGNSLTSIRFTQQFSNSHLISLRSKSFQQHIGNLF